jgi:palmitoyltransferase
VLSANETFSQLGKQDTKKVLKEWVNARTKGDEFSALHYAAFRGNIDMCKTLIDLGADKNVKNVNGLSFLHIAA